MNIGLAFITGLTAGGHRAAPRLGSLAGRTLLFGAAYLACAAAGHFVSSATLPFVSFWLPSGLFVATLLRQESRHWPAFAAMAFFANLGFDVANGQALGVGALFATGNCLEALTGAWLVRRFVAAQPDLSTVREVGGLLGLAALFSTTISASIGAFTVVVVMGRSSLSDTWPLWWSGDALGVLLLAPLILAWRKSVRWWFTWRLSARHVEAGALVGWLCFSAGFSFLDAWHPGFPVKYVLIPSVLWAAFRFGMRATAVASLTVALVAAGLTARGYADIALSGLSAQGQMAALQFFLVVVTLTGLFLAAVLSERRKAEVALRESEDRFRTLVENIPQKIFLKDRDFHWVSVNEHFARDFRLRPEEVVGKTDYDLFPKELADKYRADDERVMRTGQAEELEGKHIKDGRETWVQVIKTPVRDGRGEVTGVFGIFWDITERRQAEESRRQQAEVLRAHNAELAASQQASMNLMDDAIAAQKRIETANVSLQREMAERQRAEAELQLTRFSVENASDGMFWMTPDARIVDVNAAACRTLGYTREELLQLRVSDIDAHYSAEIWPQHFAELRQRGSMTFASEQRTKDGRLIPMEIVANYIKFGGEERNCAFVRDITERKRAEEALKESEERFRTLANAAFEGIAISEQGRLVDVNEQTLAMFGATRPDMIGHMVLEFIAPDSRAEVTAAVDAETEVVYEHQLRRKDGTMFMAEACARMLRHGERHLRITALRDITERKQAETALRASEKRLADITFSLADWVWEVDEKGVYTYSSPQGFNYFGPAREDVIGKTPFDFMAPDEVKRVGAIFAGIAARKAPIKDLENWNITKHGERICLLTNGVPILDEAGNLKGYRGVDKDITERKRAEEKINQQLEELQRWNKVTLGREDRVQQLKREVNQLLAQLGKPVRYASQQEEAGAPPPQTQAQPGDTPSSLR